MFSYTKRELVLLSALLALVILIIFDSLFFYFSNFNFIKQENTFSKKQIYSTTIPIAKINSDNVISNQYEEFAIEENNQGQQNNKEKTQRQIIKDNDSNKWRIQIPKLNLDVHIMEGTSDDILLKAVGHFKETTKWKGNVGLAAHNRGYKCNFFEKIKNLKLGDEIIYLTINGKKVYKVVTNKVIKDNDWNYLKPTIDNKITLITCEENRPNYRRCVQAVEIAEYKI